jgi:hypothetical protein
MPERMPAPSVFKEMYKGRIIEAVRRGNAKRPGCAIVDGFRASPSRSTTSTFSSPMHALKGAKGMVDDQIADLSQLRSRDPASAVFWAKASVEEAEGVLRRARDRARVEQASALLERVKKDLLLAEGAVAKANAPKR